MCQCDSTTVLFSYILSFTYFIWKYCRTLLVTWDVRYYEYRPHKHSSHIVISNTTSPNLWYQSNEWTSDQKINSLFIKCSNFLRVNYARCMVKTAPHLREELIDEWASLFDLGNMIRNTMGVSEPRFLAVLQWWRRFIHLSYFLDAFP